jgi:uncharacterized protein YdaU (DUF1376 family)
VSPPYIPFYIDDFDAATAHLTAAEEGVYMRLIKMAWRSATCSIFDDLDNIARKCRVSKSEVEPILNEFFFLKKKMWVQKRLLKEFSDVLQKSNTKREAGKKGAEIKALKKKEKSVSIPKLLLKEKNSITSTHGRVPEPEPEPEPEPPYLLDGAEEAVPASQPSAVSKREFPDDWPKGFAHSELIKLINSPWLDGSKSAGLAVAGQVAQWRTQGCSWLEDVVPVVTGIVQASKKPIGSWSYFSRAIYENRDTRLKAGPPLPVVKRVERTDVERAGLALLDQFRRWDGMGFSWPSDGGTLPSAKVLKAALDAHGDADDHERFWLEGADLQGFSGGDRQAKSLNDSANLSEAVA